ncbi:MAG: hypothetical protein EDS66_04670 [Planctomycetota bacterium]|nr:MAG: hypothetical protein EDS66_04670 [Planctomycetota bacterium]MCQ3920359.1 hypothetical protein [Planctomycetota bacterium]
MLHRRLFDDRARRAGSVGYALDIGGTVVVFAGSRAAGREAIETQPDRLAIRRDPRRRSADPAVPDA